MYLDIIIAVICTMTLPCTRSWQRVYSLLFEHRNWPWDFP